MMNVRRSLVSKYAIFTVIIMTLFLALFAVGNGSAGWTDEGDWDVGSDTEILTNDGVNATSVTINATGILRVNGTLLMNATGNITVQNGGQLIISNGTIKEANGTYSPSIRILSGGKMWLYNGLVTRMSKIRVKSGGWMVSIGSRMDNFTGEGLWLEEGGIDVRDTEFHDFTVASSAIRLEGGTGYIAIRNCLFNNTDVALAVGEPGGGWNGEIYVNGTDMMNIADTAVWGRAPSWNAKLFMTDVKIKGSGHGIYFTYLGDIPMGHVNLTNVRFNGESATGRAVHLPAAYDDVHIENTVIDDWLIGIFIIEALNGPEFRFKNVSVSNITGNWYNYGLHVNGNDVSTVMMRNVTVRDFTGIFTYGISIEDLAGIEIDGVTVQNVLDRGLSLDGLNSASLEPTDLLVDDTCNDVDEIAVYVEDASPVIFDSTCSITNNYAHSVQIGNSSKVDLDGTVITGNGFDGDSNILRFIAVTDHIAIKGSTISGNEGTAVNFSYIASTGHFFLNDTDLSSYTGSGVRISIDSSDLMMDVTDSDFLPGTGSDSGIECHDGASSTRLSSLNLTGVTMNGYGASGWAVRAPLLGGNALIVNTTADNWPMGFSLARDAGSLQFNFTNVQLSNVTGSGAEYGLYISGGSSTTLSFVNTTVRDLTGSGTYALHILNVNGIPTFNDVTVQNTQDHGVYINGLGGGSLMPTGLIVDDVGQANDDYGLYVFNSAMVSLDPTSALTNVTGTALYLDTVDRIKVVGTKLWDNGIDSNSNLLMFRGADGYIALDDLDSGGNLGTQVYFYQTASVGNFYLNGTDLADYSGYGIWMPMYSPSLFFDITDSDLLPGAGSLGGIRFGTGAIPESAGSLNMTGVEMHGNGATGNAVRVGLSGNLSLENVIADNWAQGLFFRRSSGDLFFSFSNISLSNITVDGYDHGFAVYGADSTDVSFKNITVRDIAGIGTNGILIENTLSIPVFNDVTVINVGNTGVYLPDLNGGDFSPTDLVISGTGTNNDYGLMVNLAGNVTLDSTVSITNHTGDAVYFNLVDNIDVYGAKFWDNGYTDDSHLFRIRRGQGDLSFDGLDMGGNIGTMFYFYLDGSSGNFYLNDTDLVGYTGSGIWMEKHCPNLYLDISNSDFLPASGSDSAIKFHDGGSANLQAGGLNLTDINMEGNGATGFAVRAELMNGGVDFSGVTADNWPAGFVLGRNSNSIDFSFANVQLSNVTGSSGSYGLSVAGGNSASVSMNSVTVRDLTGSDTDGIALQGISSAGAFSGVSVVNTLDDGVVIDGLNSADLTLTDLAIVNTGQDNGDIALDVSDAGDVVFAGTASITNSSGTAISFDAVEDIDLDGASIWDNGFDQTSYLIMIDGAEGYMAFDSLDMGGNHGTIFNFHNTASAGVFHLNDTDLIDYSRTGILVSTDCPGLVINVNGSDFLPASTSDSALKCINGSTETELGGLSLYDVEMFGNSATGYAVLADLMTGNVHLEMVNADDWSIGMTLGRSTGTPQFAFSGLKLSNVTGDWWENGLYIKGGDSSTVSMDGVVIRDFQGSSTRALIIKDVNGIPLFNDVTVENTQDYGITIDDLNGGAFAPTNLRINDTGSSSGDRAFIIDTATGVVLDSTVSITNSTVGYTLYLDTVSDLSVDSSVIRDNGFDDNSRTVLMKGCSGYISFDTVEIIDNLGTPFYFLNTASTGTFHLNDTDLIGYTSNAISSNVHQADLSMELIGSDLLPGAGSSNGIFLNTGTVPTQIEWLNITNSEMTANGASGYAVSSELVLGGVELTDVRADGWTKGITVARGSGSPAFSFEDLVLSNITGSWWSYGLYASGGNSAMVSMDNVTVRDLSGSDTDAIIIASMGDITLFRDVTVESTLNRGVYINGLNGGDFSPNGLYINDTGDEGSSAGLYVRDAGSGTWSTGTIVIGNTSGKGIHLEDCNDLMIDGVELYNVGSMNEYGLQLEDCTGIEIIGPTIDTTGESAIYLEDADSTWINGSKIMNSGGSYVVRIEGGSDDVWFYNGSLDESIIGFGIWDGGSHVWTVNTTYETENTYIQSPSSTNLTIAWYCSLEIIDNPTDMTPAHPVNINFNDTNGDTYHSSVTQPDGFLNWTILPELVMGRNAMSRSPYRIDIWNSTWSSGKSNVVINESLWLTIPLEDPPVVAWTTAGGADPLDLPWTASSFELRANASDISDVIYEMRYNTTDTNAEDGILMDPVDGAYEDHKEEEANATIDCSDTGIWTVGYSVTYYVWAFDGQTWGLSDSVTVTVNDDSAPTASNATANGSQNYDKPWTHDSMNVSVLISDSENGSQAIIAAEFFIDSIGAFGSGTSLTALDGGWDSATEWGYSIIDTSNKTVWSVGSFHTFYLHGHDGSQWGDFAMTTVTVHDDSAPGAANVQANGDSPHIAIYPYDPVNITAMIDDSGSGGQDIIGAEYFIDTIGASGTGTAMFASDGSYDSDSELVYSVSSLSGMDFGESRTYHVHGEDASGWGAYDSVIVNRPGVDSIQIVDELGANGTPFGSMVVNVGYSVTGYISFFNDTHGFIGYDDVAWSLVNVTGAVPNLGDLGGTDETVEAGLSGGVFWWNASYDGVNDSVRISVLAPTVNNVVMVHSGDTGLPSIGNRMVGVLFTKSAWLASFNDTAGYIGDVSPTWQVWNDGSFAYIDNATGLSTQFNANTTGGLAVWNASYFDGGAWFNDSVEYTVLAPLADSMVIDDMAGAGGSGIADATVDVGAVIDGYSAGYNNTMGYMGDLNANWTLWGNTTSTSLPAQGQNSTFSAGTAGGFSLWNATFWNGEGMIYDSIRIEVNPPVVDYIDVVDQWGTGELPIGSLTMNAGDSVEGFAASFNSTAGYIGDVNVDWSVMNAGGSVSYIDPDNGTSTTFFAGNEGGSTVWKASLFIGVYFNDSVAITIIAPAIDRIEIVTEANTTFWDRTVKVGFNSTGWAGSFNDTIGFLGYVTADWYANNTLGSTSSTVGPGPDINSTYFAGSTGGICWWNASYFDGSDWNGDSVYITIREPTADYINIVDSPGTGTNPIGEMTVPVGAGMTGYSAAFNYTSGYITDVSSTWRVAGNSSAETLPGSGTSSIFDAGHGGGSAVWKASHWDNESWYNDSIAITVLEPTIDSIAIVDTSGTGTSMITDMTVDVGFEITGFASVYNDTSGFLRDVMAIWTVEGIGSIDPLTESSNNTYSAGLSGGQGWWNLSYDNGNHTYSVRFDIRTPVVDRIDILDASGGSGLPISPATVDVGFSISGWTAAYNNTAGYLYDVSSAWSVDADGDADTTPSTGASSTFNAGNTGGSANWTAMFNDSGSLHYDSIQYVVRTPTVDSIDIVDTPGTGVLSIGNPTVNVGYNTTGYSSAYNDTAGYLFDALSNWTAEGNATASTDPMTNSNTSTLDIGLIGGTVWWNASYWSGGWFNDSVRIEVLDPGVDWIVIENSSGGVGPEAQDMTMFTTDSAVLYAIGYNTTSGFVDDVNADWSTSDPRIGNLSDLSGSVTTFIGNGSYAGNTTITADLDGMTDIVMITTEFENPGIDKILIRSGSNGTGISLDDVAYNVGATDEYYAASYNDTFGFLGDIDVNWSSSKQSVGTVGPDGTNSTTFQASSTTGGSTMITAVNGSLSDVLNVTVRGPTVDYVRIIRNDTSVMTDRTVSVGDIRFMNAGGFNLTAGFTGAVSADWFSSDNETGDISSEQGFWTLFIGNSNRGGVTNITIIYNTMEHSIEYIVRDPTLDTIAIVDELGGSGTEVDDLSYHVGAEENLYATGFNDTSGYLIDVEASWSSTRTDNATVENGPSNTTLLEASSTHGGWARIWANYLGILDYVNITIADPVIDEILIINSTGYEVNFVRVKLKGERSLRAGSYNDTAGYLGDVSADWSSSKTTVGVVDPGPSASTTFYANDSTSGTAFVTADFSEFSDDIEFRVLSPVIDRISITFSPNGAVVGNEVFPVGITKGLHASSYNDTVGYYGTVPAMWSVNNTVASSIVSGPTPTATFTASSGQGGAVLVTANYSGIIDTADILVLEPVIDGIIIADSPGAGGNEVQPQILNVNERIELYATSFNDTAGFLGDINATWTSSNSTLLNLSSTIASNVTAQASDITGGVFDIDITFQQRTDTLRISVRDPEADSIQIRTGNDDDGKIMVFPHFKLGKKRFLWCAGYNDTSGFIGNVYGQWRSSDTNITTLQGMGQTVLAEASNKNHGTVIINVSHKPLNLPYANYSFTLKVIAPVIDLVRVRDQPGNAGNIATDVNLKRGGYVVLFSAGYNDTLGYMGDVNATWTSSNEFVVDLSLPISGLTVVGPGVVLTAGTRGGSGSVLVQAGSVNTTIKVTSEKQGESESAEDMFTPMNCALGGILIAVLIILLLIFILRRRKEESEEDSGKEEAEEEDREDEGGEEVEEETEDESSEEEKDEGIPPTPPQQITEEDLDFDEDDPFDGEEEDLDWFAEDPSVTKEAEVKEIDPDADLTEDDLVEEDLAEEEDDFDSMLKKIDDELGL